MTMEEVTRQNPPSSGSPDTDDFRKNFVWVYLEKQQICLAENSNLVSEEHNYRRGDTTWLPRRAVLLIQTIFEKTFSEYISRNRSVWLKIRTLYQENITIEEVAWREPSSSGSPDQTIFKKTLSGNISRTSKSIWLKIGTLYQEDMTIEEVARQEPRLAVLLIQNMFE